VIKLAPYEYLPLGTLKKILAAVSETGKIEYFANHLLVCFDVHCHMYGSKGTRAKNGVFDEELVCKLLFREGKFLSPKRIRTKARTKASCFCNRLKAGTSLESS
jgi:hypothetical protein